MHDRPDVDELLRAVEELLDEQLIPALEGSSKYNARVASNVLRIVRRELAAEEEQLHAEWRGLDALLGETASPARASERRRALLDRNEALSARIRSGDADDGAWARAVRAHIRETVRAKLVVSDPGWLEAE